jgi:hypothetical protein
MRFVSLFAIVCLVPATLIADDRELLSRTSAATSKSVITKEPPGKEPASTVVKNHNGSNDALDEVNEYRARLGLAPFIKDDLLTQAAQKAASIRAANLINGHLRSDFDCLPAGAQADAAGCGALDDSWGWGTCCATDSYTYAGAAWVRGSDGKRYMHLFVRSAGASPTNGGSRVVGTGSNPNLAASYSQGDTDEQSYSSSRRGRGRRGR